MSELCEAYGIDPSQFSQWKKSLFEGGPQMFASRGKRGREDQTAERRVQEMEQEITRMHEVVAEIAAENIALKKRTGRS